MLRGRRALPRFVVVLLVAGSAQATTSLRFFGNGTNDIDRVKIRIDAPQTPADIGTTDLTVEFWMKALAAENGNRNCVDAIDKTWIRGNILIDRDVFGNGDFGDYGLSLYSDGLAFGVSTAVSARTICSATDVDDGQWHHVAVTRSIGSGLMRIFIDGELDAEGTGPTGNLSYRDGRNTSWPDSDPFLVLGAEKHDANPGEFPSYSGWLDELRLSTNVRYVGGFVAPTQPFTPDPSTAALYHFDEGSGDVIGDATPGGASPGQRRFGGSPAGPLWDADEPFGASAGSLRFVAGAASVGEADGVVTITARRLSGSSGAVSVDYASADVTATAGADYQPVSGTLSWADGDNADRSFQLVIIDDADDEGDETLTLTLSSPSGGATLANPATATLTISDDDAPASAGSLQFTQASRTIGEGGGSVSTQVSRGGGSSGAVSVNYATADGSAIGGADYEVAMGTLNWADGDATVKSFTIRITDDAQPEGAETLSVGLSSPTGGAALGAPATAVLTIADNDAGGPPPAPDNGGGGLGLLGWLGLLAAQARRMRSRGARIRPGSA